MFGNKKATSFLVNSATQITAIAPAEALGTVTITVVTPAGISKASGEDRFTFQALRPGSSNALAAQPTTVDSAAVLAYWISAEALTEFGPPSSKAAQNWWW